MFLMFFGIKNDYNRRKAIQEDSRTYLARKYHTSGELSCRHVVTLASAKKTLVTGRLLLSANARDPLWDRPACALQQQGGLAHAHNVHASIPLPLPFSRPLRHEQRFVPDACNRCRRGD